MYTSDHGLFKRIRALGPRGAESRQGGAGCGWRWRARLGLGLRLDEGVLKEILKPAAAAPAASRASGAPSPQPHLATCGLPAVALSGAAGKRCASDTAVGGARVRVYTAGRLAPRADPSIEWSHPSEYPAWAEGWLAWAGRSHLPRYVPSWACSRWHTRPARTQGAPSPALADHESLGGDL